MLEMPSTQVPVEIKSDHRECGEQLERIQSLQSHKRQNRKKRIKIDQTSESVEEFEKLTSIWYNQLTRHTFLFRNCANELHFPFRTCVERLTAGAFHRAPCAMVCVFIFCIYYVLSRIDSTRNWVENLLTLMCNCPHIPPINNQHSIGFVSLELRFLIVQFHHKLYTCEYNIMKFYLNTATMLIMLLLIE